MIKNFIKNTFLYNYVRRAKYNIDFVIWHFNKKDNSFPHKLKQNIVLEYIKSYSPQIFIETGTYYGDMLFAVKKMFSRIYSIELSKSLAKKAARRFIKNKNITILQGNSAEKLADILPSLTTNNLFWLDAHYSSGVTACGDKVTPIEEELSLIFNSTTEQNVILIDDARLFTGFDDYPTIEKIRELTLLNKPQSLFEVKDDIIRITY